MFTLKHVHDNGETLFMGDEPQLNSNMDSSDGRTASYVNANGVRIYITGGVVYVMNDTGRTVAKYDLGPKVSEAPESRTGRGSGFLLPIGV